MWRTVFTWGPKLSTGHAVRKTDMTQPARFPVPRSRRKTPACSFCKKPEAEVRQLVVQPSAAICDECLVKVNAELAGKPKEAGAQPARPVAVIPARYASTRFPGKPLASIAGKPMVRHVYDRCVESQAFARIVVATDDQRIVAEVRAFGGEAELTSPACASGTDRVAEVARRAPAGLGGSADVWVNVQGDEPAVHPEALRTLAAAFADPRVEMATLVRPLAEAERNNPNVVKAVVGVDGFALYFSRSDVPFVRGEVPPVARYGHLGLYGYRRATLLRLAALPPTPLERAESLEQLRALENGIRIACKTTPHASAGVDRPEDVAVAAARLKALGLV